MQKIPFQQGHTRPRSGSRYGSAPDLTQATTAIDLCTALYLVTVAVCESGEELEEEFSVSEPDPPAAVYASHGAPCSLVGHALYLAGIGIDELEGMRGSRLRDLFARGKLPVAMTLGAVAVLDAAGQRTDRKDQWRRGLEQASTAGARFLDLLPDAGLDTRDTATDRLGLPFSAEGRSHQDRGWLRRAGGPGPALEDPGTGGPGSRSSSPVQPRTRSHSG